MKNKLPISRDIIDGKFEEMGISEAGKASIREIVRIANLLESETGVKFIRMEMGIPGLKAPQVAIEAEIAALRNGCAEKYPNIDGIPEIKREISRFVKAFINVDVSERSCVPTVGSINGNYAAFLTTGRMEPEKDTVLFIVADLRRDSRFYSILRRGYLWKPSARFSATVNNYGVRSCPLYQ